MKLIRFSVLLLILTMAPLMFAEKVAVLEDINKPFMMEIDGDRLFISQEANIFIYSMKDYKLIKKFGKLGEGPREFKVNPTFNAGSVWMNLEKDQLLINSVGRISYFTKDGEYIKEVSTPNGVFQPMNNQYVAYGFKQDPKAYYVTVDIYDEHFKSVKELYRQKQFYQREKEINFFDMIGPLHYFYKGVIYVKCDDGVIRMFDPKGEAAGKIEYAYQQHEVSEEFKKSIFDFYKDKPSAQQFYQLIKARMQFPKYYTPIRWFTISDDHVFVVTYFRKDDLNEMYVFDTKGKFVKRLMIPFFSSTPMMFSPYDTDKGRILQLKEAEEEGWELHINNLL